MIRCSGVVREYELYGEDDGEDDDDGDDDGDGGDDDIGGDDDDLILGN